MNTQNSDGLKMDLLDEMGALALGSRLKRLSDALMQDGVKIYQQLGMGFEPRWFPVFSYLYRRGPTSITELARGLGVSHPGINKIANELIDARLVMPYRDRKDKRKRVLALTRTGREKYESLAPVWRDIRRSLQCAVEEGGGEFIANLSALEESFRTKDFFTRFVEQSSKPDRVVEVVSYRPEYASAFHDLNQRWILDYFTTLEPADSRVLGDPEGTILADGGEVLFAVAGDEVLGTCAILNTSRECAELAKMAVADAARGQQVGSLLGQAAVEKARARGWQKLLLESNRKLTPAIALYRKLGFVETPFPHPSEYSRADIHMELALSDTVGAG